MGAVDPLKLADLAPVVKLCEVQRMADPNTPGLKTTEFLLTFLANALGAVLASGLVTGELWLRGLGIASIIATTAVYTWQRGALKVARIDAAATDSSTKKPDAGFIELRLLTVMALCTSVPMMLALGCSALGQEAKKAASSVVDCTKTGVREQVAELRPLGGALITNAVSDGKLEWGPVRDVAKGFVTDVGRCVLADAISRLLAKPADGAPKLLPFDVDADKVRVEFRALASELYGGARFKTESGEL